MAIGVGCGAAWTLVMTYAVFGSAHVIGWPVRLVPALLTVPPFLAMLLALLVYARRDLGRWNARVIGGIIVGATLLMGEAARILPSYERDGLWVINVWLSTGLIISVEVFSLAMGSWPVRSKPHAKDRPGVGPHH